MAFRSSSSGSAALQREAVPEADAPSSFKGLVACRRCYLVKTYEQFYTDGCENCIFLSLKENKDQCDQCTSRNYNGVIAMLRPTKSWVARWQGIAQFCSGAYAIRVNDPLPNDIRQTLIDKGIPVS